MSSISQNSAMEKIGEETPQSLNPPPTQIFILSGQSNMAGRGGVVTTHHNHRRQKQWDGLIPPECQSHPEILRLSADLRWETAAEPLHADIDTKKVCGLGPGMSFINVVKDSTRCGGGLVPCAVGGTAIREWARGEELYEKMVKRCKESVRSGAEIKCLLWYQGESDTSTEQDAMSYQGKMEELIRNVREDLGLPQLPVIQVALASGVEDKYVEKVREAQLGMKMEKVVCVDAKGLKLKEDNLHLTTEAQIKLGQMLAHAYLANFVVPSPSPPSS
ncbi:Probable carbohydrate esterase At4g34215 [Linum grandiflorum]